MEESLLRISSDFASELILQIQKEQRNEIDKKEYLH